VFKSDEGKESSVIGTTAENALTFTFTNSDNSLGMHWSAAVATSRTLKNWIYRAIFSV